MYDPKFIPGFEVPMPQLSESLKARAFQNGEPVHHARFSIIFSRERHFAIATAHNIDGETLIPEGVFKRKDSFKNDPDIPAEIQVDNNRGYRKNPWDRGHLVRRRAMHWGDQTEAFAADQESFYYSNITPQHKRLHHSAWGKIEDWMMDFADAHKKRACVFTGPVFSDSDPKVVNLPGEKPVRIPAGFWKVLTISHGLDLRAAGFLVWQRDFDNPKPLGFQPFLEQVRITTIEYLTGLNFGELRNLDPLRYGIELAEGKSLDEQTIAPKPIKRAAVVTSPFDIFMG
ncbi:MAG: DNA/RNA non-specific endonuclease [Bacteroidetes bacterium]|nr:MAG: DNA/RNA non-specific endonuclease [Bacteroidota bacterium]